MYVLVTMVATHSVNLTANLPPNPTRHFAYQ